MLAPSCVAQIGLCHPLDGIANPKYQSLVLLKTIFFTKSRRLAFNKDRWCHLALCLWLILFHWLVKLIPGQLLQTTNTLAYSYVYKKDAVQ